MGERLLCKQEVDGSNPFTSTKARLIQRARARGKRRLFVEDERGPARPNGVARGR